jgi:hypothetical protein
MRKPWVRFSERKEVARRWVEAYGFEGSDFADAVVGRDIVHCHTASLDETQVGVLLDALECAILRAEVESSCPVVAKSASANLFLTLMHSSKTLRQRFHFPPVELLTHLKSSLNVQLVHVLFETKSYSPGFMSA